MDYRESWCWLDGNTVQGKSNPLNTILLRVFQNTFDEIGMFLEDVSLICFFRLELMCERAEQRSDELERSLQLLDRWKRRGDDLLYSMIPRSVADRLRKGQSSLSTCEVRTINLGMYLHSNLSNISKKLNEGNSNC